MLYGTSPLTRYFLSIRSSLQPLSPQKLKQSLSPRLRWSLIRHLNMLRLHRTVLSLNLFLTLFIGHLVRHLCLHRPRHLRLLQHHLVTDPPRVSPVLLWLYPWTLWITCFGHSAQSMLRRYLSVPCVTYPGSRRQGQQLLASL